MVKVNHSAKETNLSFYYQTLVGLDKCFELKEGESIYFEKDGDVSFIDKNGLNATNIEVKHYSDNLTDNHENFWKTLKNWLAPEFKQEQYRFLMLCTTQPYGRDTLFENWNNENIDGRFHIIMDIINRRDMDSDDSKMAKIQKNIQDIIQSEEMKFKEVVSKIVLLTEYGGISQLEDKICNRLFNISQEYHFEYLENLIGFVYMQAQKNNDWVIEYDAFNKKNLELTSHYSKLPFVFPKLNHKMANPDEVDEHQDKLFVSKIKDIDYDEVVPEAIGCYLELINSLNDSFKKNPGYKSYTDSYRDELVVRLHRKYRTAVRKKTDSKDFYDEVFNETPFTINTNIASNSIHRDGLIHEIMDMEKVHIDNTQIDLRWDTKQ